MLNMIRLVVSPFFVPSPPRQDSHLHSIPVGKELLRKGPRNPYVKKLIQVYCSRSTDWYLRNIFLEAGNPLIK